MLKIMFHSNKNINKQLRFKLDCHYVVKKSSGRRKVCKVCRMHQTDTAVIGGN